MNFNRPVTEIIRQRYSCRNYMDQAIADETINAIKSFLAKNTEAPFKSAVRAELIASSGGDSEMLKGLGTYGFIKNPAGFIIGAASDAEMNLEDYGYLMEKNILFATSLGLGSCWLGGSFRKSKFADRIAARKNEQVPAAVSIGDIANKESLINTINRNVLGSARRKPWNELFFAGNFDTPLSPDAAGRWADAIEMLRLAPSASNKQPWRVVKEEGRDIIHFYLERSRNYTWQLKLLGLADLQRIDMGIGMCHFDLTAAEAGVSGRWEKSNPGIESQVKREYVASWIAR